MDQCGDQGRKRVPGRPGRDGIWPTSLPAVMTAGLAAIISCLSSAVFLYSMNPAGLDEVWLGVRSTVLVQADLTRLSARDCICCSVNVGLMIVWSRRSPLNEERSLARDRRRATMATVGLTTPIFSIFSGDWSFCVWACCWLWPCFALRLWHLQIREGPYYRDLSENNRTRSVVLEPARGPDFRPERRVAGEQCAEFCLVRDAGGREGSSGVSWAIGLASPLDPEVIQKNRRPARAENCSHARSKTG